MYIGFHSPDAGVVHHLQARRDDSRCNDRCHGFTGRFHIVKCCKQDLVVFRFGQQFQRDFDHYSQHAFGAGHQGQQVKARRIKRVTSHFQQFTINCHHFQAQNIVHG